MDKYDLVLDVIAHPENYSAEQMEQIFSDPEAKEIYNLLCVTDSAVESAKKVDVDAEWKAFSRKRKIRSARFAWFGSRAASIIAFAATSLVAVALGVVVTVAVKGNRTTALEDSGAPAQIAAAPVRDTVAVVQDTILKVAEPVMFEDAPLEDIMAAIARTYSIEVVFKNKDVAGLHLYYKYNPSLSLEEVISQLNTFEQINLVLEGKKLTVN